MNAEGRRAVFLDRDGTLIADPGYLRDPGRVELLPGAAAALAELARRGALLVVVSNQSGIGRGLITPQEARSVHDRFAHLLEQAGVALDDAYYCPHAPDAGCTCRKPLPGMLLQAAREHGIDLDRSTMIGNSADDIAAGQAAGAFTILLLDGKTDATQIAPDAVAASWGDVGGLVPAEAGAKQ
ncbi:MAG: HAD family hydrolase [Solirubrobacteraceae bacterium]|jgi:histidinol-phosphate phosphatase family protein